MDFNGIMYLNVVTTPVLKTIKTSDGSTAEFWELTLSDGKRVFNNVSGDKNFDFSKLESSHGYPFIVIPQFKSASCISSNGKQYNRNFNIFKVMRVASEADLKTFVSEAFSK